MKKVNVIILGLAVLLLISCSNSNEQEKKSDNKKELVHNESIDKGKEIVVLIEGVDTFKFNETDISTFKDYFRLNAQDVSILSPDLSYESRNRDNDEIELMYSSEAGLDNFYILYSHVLKEKNGVEDYKDKREDLIQIYRKINSLHNQLHEGGTYFGHQHKRIHGIAEYSIYTLNGNDRYTKTYEITTQKSYFTSALKEYFANEVNADSGLSNEEKTEKIDRLNVGAEELSEQITDFFYLKKAQSFNYSYY